MKQFYKIVATYWMVLIFSFIIFNASGCNQDTSLNAVENNSSSDSGMMEKKIKTTTTTTTTTSTYPQVGSCSPKYSPKWNAYNGDLINIPNGSQFSFLYGALTPPSGWVMGSKITITMQVSKQATSNALVYTFGPSGCQFDPAAAIWLSWDDLSGTGVPNLYLIDSTGNYNLQIPDDINVLGRTLKINIHHFSRYALAFSQ